MPNKSRRREQAILALLTEPTIERAATAAGIGLTTLKRWLRDEGFQNDFRRAKEQMIQAATTALRKKAAGAVEVLENVSNDPTAPAGSRVSAASRIVEFALRAHETENLEERIRRLEEQSEN